MDTTQLFFYACAGLIVGAIVGATGVGGGSVMTPILTTAFAVPAQIAVGTDLVFAAITKSVGTVAHDAQGTVHWRAVKYLLIGSIPASLLTLFALWQLEPNGEHLNQITKKIVGASVLLTVALLIYRRKLLAWQAANPKFILNRAKRKWALIIGGAVIGTLVTLTSIGAGAIGATLLVLAHPEWDAVDVAGTDIAYAVPLTLVAGAGHALLGTVNWPLLAGLLFGSLPGIAVGSRLAKHIPDGWLRGVLIAALGFAGFKLIT